MKKNVVSDYIKSSFQELTKVTWPTKNQAVRLTIIVFVFCLVFSVALGAVDFGFSEMYNFLLGLR